MNLDDAVAANEFRGDLFYRLDVVRRPDVGRGDWFRDDRQHVMKEKETWDLQTWLDVRL